MYDFESEGLQCPSETTLDPELAAEAKSLVALAFRNGPIEEVHAGIGCPTCAGKSEYSHITQAEMKNIMKQAVDTVYKLLWLKRNDPEQYETMIELGSDTRGFGTSRKRLGRCEEFGLLQ
jgi:hypothetical protein